MNFTEYNKVASYITDNILSKLNPPFAQLPISDFFVKYSKIPSGQWCKLDTMRALPFLHLVDDQMFIEKYKDKCLSLLCPIDPKDGAVTMLFQLKPDLILYGAVYAWYEHNLVHSYIKLVGYSTTIDRLMKVQEELIPMRKTGNTEEPPTKGFSILPR